MLKVGDRVVDRDAEEPDIMRVLQLNIGKAHNVVIADIEKSVSEVNPEYPEDDEVVETVYESWLDHNVPMWKKWTTDHLAEKLNQYSKQWNVPIQSYYYPKTRLIKLEFK